MRGLLFAAVLALLLANGLALAEKTEDDLIWDLCDGTVAALQNTPAAPLAALFSPEASSLLIAQGDKALHLSRPRLLKMERWSDRPLFTAEAEPQPMLSVPGRGSVRHLITIVSDGEKSYWLDGMTEPQGGALKWLMLAIVPETRVASGKELDGLREALAPLFLAWEAGDTAAVTRALAPDDVAVCMLGPDQHLQVFGTPSEVETALKGVRDLGGARISEVDLTEGVLSPAVATVTVGCKVGVGTMKPESETLLIHLYRDDGRWKVSGLWAH